MTAPHARQPQVLPRPACTPAAIKNAAGSSHDLWSASIGRLTVCQGGLPCRSCNLSIKVISHY